VVTPLRCHLSIQVFCCLKPLLETGNVALHPVTATVKICDFKIPFALDNHERGMLSNFLGKDG
jgi:hypothetical protein